MNTDKEPKKGVNRGNAGKGRPKGAPNKINAELKEMILQALNQSGGVGYLMSVAASHPPAFVALLGKVLPMTLQGAGEDGEIVITAIERRIVKAE